MAKISQQQANYREGNPRRRCGLAGVVLAAMLACWSGNAFGNPFDEVPKKYRGMWCSGRVGDEYTEFYRRCRPGERPGDYSMEINAHQFGDGRYSECVTIIALPPNHGDLIVQAACRNGPNGNPELFDQRWRVLDGGRRLKVITPAPG